MTLGNIKGGEEDGFQHLEGMVSFFTWWLYHVSRKIHSMYNVPCLSNEWMLYRHRYGQK